jgi:accessory gene regulator B
MIEQVSLRIASRIWNANPSETASIAVMKYALSIILSSLMITTLSLGIGLIFSLFYEVLLCLLIIGGLRMVCGGRHLKSLDNCVVVSVVICTGVPIITDLIPSNTYFIVLIHICSTFFIYRYWESRYAWNEYVHAFVKVATIFAVNFNLLLQNGVIAYAVLIVSVAMIRGGAKNGEIFG